MSTMINKYELLAPFQSKDAGFSRWTYAQKDGRQFFLKEFTDPVYPTEKSISPALREQMIDFCKKYERKKKRLYEAVNRASAGNLVRITEFFRNDNHYYIATERVPALSFSADPVRLLTYESKLLLCRSLAFEIMRLHKEHVVHGDIKKTNILLKRTAGGKIIGKVIDFDAGFFEDDPPAVGEELCGDQIYLSPEGCQFICGEPAKLTCKMDVFALGLLFHEYLTGRLPAFDHTEYDYAFDAVLDGQSLGIDPGLPYLMRTMLENMFRREPEKRCSMEQVYTMFKEMDPNPEEKPEEMSAPGGKEKHKQVDQWFYRP